MVNAIKKIGLTGSIGSGKSVVASLFESWGSKIIDFDIIARELLSNNQDLISQLSSYFGSQILRPDKSIDRFALRSIVFLDSEARTQLENIIHPLIRSEAKKQLNDFIAAGSRSITLVIPLLFESKSPYPDLSCTVVVNSSRENSISRASLRDSCSNSLISKIYDAQMPIETKANLADYVIANNGNLDELRINAKSVYDQIHGN